MKRLVVCSQNLPQSDRGLLPTAQSESGFYQEGDAGQSMKGNRDQDAQEPLVLPETTRVLQVQMGARAAQSASRGSHNHSEQTGGFKSWNLFPPSPRAHSQWSATWGRAGLRSGWKALGRVLLDSSSSQWPKCPGLVVASHQPPASVVLWPLLHVFVSLLPLLLRTSHPSLDFRLTPNPVTSPGASLADHICKDAISNRATLA